MTYTLILAAALAVVYAIMAAYLWYGYRKKMSL